MGGFPLPWGGAVGMRRLTPPRGGRGPGLPPPSSLTAPPAGLWVLSPRTQQTSALRIAAARGYEECARHLLLCGAEVDAVVGGRGALHDSVAAPRPSCARLLLSFGADPNLLSSDGSAPLHLCTAPDSLQYAPPPAPSPAPSAPNPAPSSACRAPPLSRTALSSCMLSPAPSICMFRPAPSVRPATPTRSHLRSGAPFSIGPRPPFGHAHSPTCALRPRPHAPPRLPRSRAHVRLPHLHAGLRLPRQFPLAPCSKPRPRQRTPTVKPRPLAPRPSAIPAPSPGCSAAPVGGGAPGGVRCGMRGSHTAPRPPRRCAELLLAHGARVNLATRERALTALHVAAGRGLAEHVGLYLRHGADPALRSRQGETPLNAACSGAERPRDAPAYCLVAERLLAAGADPAAAGRKGHTPLHNACGNAQYALARLLLRHGADPAATNGAGDTPMDCALRAVPEYRPHRPERTVALLLEHGAGPARPEVGGGGARRGGGCGTALKRGRGGSGTRGRGVGATWGCHGVCHRADVTPGCGTDVTRGSGRGRRGDVRRRETGARGQRDVGTQGGGDTGTEHGREMGT